MKISVIVPLYNKAPYLTRALNSIWSQDFEDFEVILVDDGSTDEGISVARTHKDSRLRIISQTNAGPGAARNRGLAEATGSFVAFLDADDEWMPNFLSAGLKRLEKACSDIASVTSGYVEMPSGISSKALCRSRGLAAGTFRLQPTTAPTYVISLLAYMTPCTTLARTVIVREMHGFYDQLGCRYGEDAHLWLKLILNKSVIVELEPRTQIYRDASNLSGNLAGARPVEPFLQDPTEIEASCPPNLRQLLAQVLAIRAYKTACVLGYWGDWRAAAALRRRFAQDSWNLMPYELASIIFSTPIGSVLGAAWRRTRFGE